MTARRPAPLLLALLAAGLNLQCSRDVVTEERLADEAFTRVLGVLDFAGYRAARPLLLDCLSRERHLGRTRREAEVLSLLGESCTATATIDSARMFLELAADRFRAAGERSSARSVTLSLAELLRQTGREREAYALCAEARRLAQLFHDTAGTQEIELAMLPLCRVLGEVNEERRILENLSSSARGGPGRSLLARAYYEGGITSRLRNRLDEAAERFTRALGLAGRTGDSLMAAKALMWLGVTADAGGKAEEAFQQFTDAVGLASRLETADRFRCELMTRIGNAYLRYRQPGEARRFYRAALPIAQRTGDRISEGFLALQLSRCDLESGSPDEAQRGAESALSLFTSMEFAAGQAYAFATLGEISERASRVTEAIERYRAAVEMLESVVRDLPPEHPASESVLSALPGGTSAAYVRLAELLLQTEQYDAAFRISERRNRHWILRLSGVLEPTAADAALQDMLGTLVAARHRAIGAAHTLRSVLEGTLPAGDGGPDRNAAFRTAVREQSLVAERIVGAVPMMEPVLRMGATTLKDAQRNVPPSAALIAVVPTRRALYSFVITRERIAVQLASVEYDRLLEVARDLEARFREVEATADSVQVSVHSPDQGLQETLRLLTQWFLRPVQADITSAARLIIMLPPELTRIPYHALRSGPLPGSPYLAESKVISYLPTASILDPAGLPAGAVRDVAGFGFSADGSWDVEYELRDIRAFYKEARLAFLQQADLSTLRREHPDLLHLAAAVNVDDLFPGNSCVVLTNGKAPPSAVPVPLGTITGLQPVEVVILSNLSHGGASFHGLIPVLFRANGTRSLVVNGYVPMRKTKKMFSELLYTGLLGGAAIGETLQRLQKEMIRSREFSSPLVWGAYFLVGS